MTSVVLSTNEPYSKVSGKFDSIHINPYFSDNASLPSTITHGIWFFDQRGEMVLDG
jgi:acyl dehydratase